MARTDGINLFGASGLEHAVVHEAVHAGSVRALGEDGPASRAFHGLFDAVKTRSPGEDAYGLTDAREFLSEGMSNPQFQEWMRGQ